MERRERKRKEKGKKTGKKLTALLDALDGRVADSLVDRIDRILDRGPGILLRVRARGEVERFAAGSQQRGARSSQRDGAEERHDFFLLFLGVLGTMKLLFLLLMVVELGLSGLKWGFRFGRRLPLLRVFGQTSLPRGSFRSSGFLFKRGIAGLFLKDESIWARFVAQLSFVIGLFKSISSRCWSARVLCFIWAFDCFTYPLRSIISINLSTFGLPAQPPRTKRT